MWNGWNSWWVNNGEGVWSGCIVIVWDELGEDMCELIVLWCG